MNTPTPCTIGVSSVGSGVGQSIVDACRLSGLPLRLVGMGNNAFAFGAFDCDARVILPGIHDPGYIDALHQSCLEFGVSLLIPGLDEELLPLARHREQFLADGIEVVVSEQSLLELCRDKERMSREMAVHTSAFVETTEAAQLLAPDNPTAPEYPLVAKPRSGFASRGVFVVNGPADIAQLTDDYIVQSIAVPRNGDPNRQAFLEGLNRGHLPQLSEISAQLVLGRDGYELGRMATCNKLTSGTPVEIVPVDIPELWEPIDQILPYLRRLGLRGPLNIQGRMTDDGPRFFEMNARFTGITGLRALMGFNEVEAVILDTHGPMPKERRLTYNPRRIGIRQTANRTLDSHYDENLKQAAEAVPGRPDASAGRHISVTGANSYLGRATINALLETPGVASITALVREPARFNEGGETPFPEDVTVRNLGDLWNGNLSLGHTDVLVHLASGRPVHQAETVSDSLRLTRDLMALATQHHLPGIINASSQSVYGLSRRPPWHEGMAPIPETPYAQAKWATELMATMPRQINHVTAATSLRFAQLTGLGEQMRWEEVPHLFIQQAIAGENITVQGGHQVLDYLHVRDAARLVALLCVQPFDQWPPVVNAGSGSPISLLDFAKLINKVTRDVVGRDAVIDVLPASVDTKKGMDIALAYEALGWHPTLDLEESLREIAHHLQPEGSNQVTAQPRSNH